MYAYCTCMVTILHIWRPSSIPYDRITSCMTITPWIHAAAASLIGTREVRSRSWARRAFNTRSSGRRVACDFCGCPHHFIWGGGVHLTDPLHRRLPYGLARGDLPWSGAGPLAYIQQRAYMLEYTRWRLESCTDCQIHRVVDSLDDVISHWEEAPYG